MLVSNLLKVGALGHILGWYHSHPGYGCWLSGIDVTTQATHQQFEDPFVAVVVSRFFILFVLLCQSIINLISDRPKSHCFCW